jgi:hypothetical protein
MLSNQYFWITVITSTCWAYLVTYPFLVARQMSDNPLGEEWKETGNEIAEGEESSYLEYIPKAGIIFYAIVMVPELGLLTFIGIFFLGYILAFLSWLIFFKGNPVKSKLFLLALWYLATGYFLYLDILKPILL